MNIEFLRRFSGFKGEDNRERDIPFNYLLMWEILYLYIITISRMCASQRFLCCDEKKSPNLLQGFPKCLSYYFFWPMGDLIRRASCDKNYNFFEISMFGSLPSGLLFKNLVRIMSSSYLFFIPIVPSANIKAENKKIPYIFIFSKTIFQ